MKKNDSNGKRNWFLVFIASLLLVLGLVLVVLAVINVDQFGWWALVPGLSGLCTVGASIMSIIKNDPTWILLNLIIPT